MSWLFKLGALGVGFQILAALFLVFYVEIGANHPIQTSNTYLLYKKYNGHGVLVDADAELIPTLEKVRPRDEVIANLLGSNHSILLNLEDLRRRQTAAAAIDVAV